MANAKPMLREEHLQDDVRGEDTHGPADPKPDPVAVAEGRIHELVTTIDVEVRKDWGATRDTMDGLMRAYEEKGLRIEELVREYTAEGEQLMAVSKVVREAADAARKEIGQRRPATLTVLQSRAQG